MRTTRRAMEVLGCWALLAVTVISTQGQTVSSAPLTVPGVIPLTPARLLDTRHGQTDRTVDGLFEGAGELPAGTTVELAVAGRGGVPADASAVFLNVTAIAGQEAGYLTVYPCGAERPLASSLNYAPRGTVANAVSSRVGDGAAVCIFTRSAAHIVVDVNGYVPHEAFVEHVVPARLLDTRQGQTDRTVDGLFEGAGEQPDGATIELSVAGRGGVPDSALAVFLNVTAVAPRQAGHLTVYPCGSPRPVASNVNYQANEVIAGAVVAKVGSEGRVCVYSRSAAHIAVDVSAYAHNVRISGQFPLVPLQPARLLETRQGTGHRSTDGLFEGVGEQAAGSTIELDVAGRGGVTARDAAAVFLNVTAIAPQQAGYLTVFPCGAPRPLASNVNYQPGGVVANAVLAKIGDGGRICIYTRAATHIAVDVSGFVDAPRHPLAAWYSWASPGTDIIGIVVCPLDPGAFDVETIYTASELAAWAQANVAPWFAEMSAGKYTQEFQAHPRAAEFTAAGSFTSCRAAARAAYRDDGFDAVIVADGFGIGLGGGSMGPGFGEIHHTDQRTWVHELGHHLGWPHSFTLPPNQPPNWVFPYQDTIEVMSGYPPRDDSDHSWPPYCVWQEQGTEHWSFCWATATSAFNRWAAGWFEDSQVTVHEQGSTTLELAAPGEHGMQMIAALAQHRIGAMLTVEARPLTGRDQYNAVGGVAVYAIDQGTPAEPRTSHARCQAPAIESYSDVPGSASVAHVLAVGARVTVHGVTVEVEAAAGSGYRVTVSGSYDPPGMPAACPAVYNGV